MEAVGEELEEGLQVGWVLEQLEPLLLGEVGCDHVEELVDDDGALDLYHLGERVQQLLGGLCVDGRVGQMQPLRRRNVFFVFAPNQHHILTVHHLERVFVLQQKLGELSDVLTGDVAHLGRCLATMAEQTADRNFRALAVLEQLVFEVVFCLLDVVALARDGRIVHAARRVAVDVYKIAVDLEQRRILREEFLETCKKEREKRPTLANFLRDLGNRWH